MIDVASQTRSPRMAHEIRRAVHGLRCDGVDGDAHAVRFVVNFIDTGRDAPGAAAVDDSPGR